MKKIILLSILYLSIAVCDLEDKDSNIREWLKIRSPRIQDLKAEVGAYQFDLDPIIRDIHNIGYDKFINSATIYTQDKVADDNIETLTNGWIDQLHLGTMATQAKLFAKGSYSYSGFLDTVFGFTTIDEGKNTKMYVILGQKKGLWDKIGDYLLIDFKQEYSLPDRYQKYHQESQMDWCPGFERVCGGHSSVGSLSEKLNSAQINWVYNFMGIVVYEYLNKLYPPIKIVSN